MRRSLLSALVVITAFSTGCSSSSSEPTGGETSSQPSMTDAATYLEGVCTELTGWQTGIEEQSQALQGSIASATSPDDVKDVLVGFLTSVVEDTNDLVATVGGLGSPDIDGGQEVAELFTQGLAQVATLFEAALSDIEDLDMSDPEAAAEALTGFGTDLEEGLSSFESAFDDIDDAELAAAAQDVPACAGLVAS